MSRADTQWPNGSVYPTAAALLLLGGAVGKSAQLPLQTWLPDAMAGPTPTSALIHAATMVTAGVYLIARTHVLFSLSATAQFAVMVIGAATLLLAGFSALTQSDIKRVLAYSTVSQIGYMFFACGVGAWSAAIFHFMSHAFFKSLLFLSAGIVINALHDEHDILKMGGLRKELPLAFWTFVIAGCSLAGLPLITAGFYSKGLIIWSGWASEKGGPGLWAVGVIGVFLTSLYIFRVIFLVFFGEVKMQVSHRSGFAMKFPCVMLAILSVVGGWVNLPSWLGNKPAFVDFVHLALPALKETQAGRFTELASESVVTLALFIGAFFAWLLFLKKRNWAAAMAAPAFSRALHQFWFSDWGMDWLYDRLFVRPVGWFARMDKNDWVDSIYSGIAGLCRVAYRVLCVTENGQIRWYVASVALGAVILIAVVLFR
jgi:NADH-quinone oxidoreductase subunit L